MGDRLAGSFFSGHDEVVRNSISHSCPLVDSELTETSLINQIILLHNATIAYFLLGEFTNALSCIHAALQKLYLLIKCLDLASKAPEISDFRALGSPDGLASQATSKTSSAPTPIESICVTMAINILESSQINPKSDTLPIRDIEVSCLTVVVPFAVLMNLFGT
jgi:hypothetical protein